MITADTIAFVHETSARSDAAYALSVDHSSVVSEAGESTRKWRPAPGELVSLWDMLRVHAETFGLLMSSLQKLEIVFLNDLRQKRSISQIEQSEKTISNLSGMSLPIDIQQALSSSKDQFELSRTEIIVLIKAMVDELRKSCDYLQLKISLAQVEKIGKLLEFDSDLSGIRQAVKELASRVEHEFRGQVFFFVPTGQLKYLEVDAEYPFGELVKNRFPKLIEDISEASKCLGFGRSTAAVFHLMRVMEGGVRRLANKMSATINLDRPWGPILKDVSDAINAMPATNPREITRKEKLHEIAAYLNHVRGAWRNSTMHPKRTYTSEEAIHLFDNVRSFMQALAKLR